ncbi:bifunctional 4-hydroxy-2-oxoglutarate aldolase/2-dehydro-3-deoxy-phosphogluconate aldolase [Streptomyces sp. NRRL WC-3742]|uniref:bifunctional 4-hydroxy-2-oxoglutarate aldolase/2-dehydro-3-deoxy-phosphogluconate aldolase n=1 Tax=Streptomyces sp. NRRL WC-3742 TaxID=1463934 RepID=UPI000A5EC9F6|nr:bifunctional 4-hydroxy-2-oxoglutarate aldolase/2-dehydro-3-deoxy-phosphogluconate aldolase [Streptomyces sp. NRRL WC-3742]
MTALDGHARLAAALRRHRLVAILRATTGTDLTAAIDALVEAGVRCLEVTLPTPGSLTAVARTRARLGEEVTIGVGTVLRATDVQRVADAGADFIVSPHLSLPVVETARDLGLGTLPGVLTPTEAVDAMAAGATAAKLFPASALGPSFAAALRAPLPDVPLVPTGGIGLADVRPWLDAGALAVAVGSPLLGDALTGGSLDELRTRAGEFVETARGGGGRA